MLHPILQKEISKDSPKYLFFWGGKSNKPYITKACFSQWSNHSFEVNGVKYANAEQFMMAGKARLFDDSEILKSILKTSDPREIKALGRKVKNFDAKIWDKKKLDVVIEGNLAKFSQDPKLFDFIIETKDKILVEASPYDRIWGIGMKEDHPHCQTPSKWKGENLLGVALMIVRDILKKKKNG